MPNIEFLTERRFTLSSHLIRIALKNNLTLIEFLLLIYFEDSVDKTFNIKNICRELSLKEEEVLSSFNHLLTLNLIKIDASKDEKDKHCDNVSLTPLYKSMMEEQILKETKEKKETIFDIFERELNRKITPMEYEIINAWLEKGFSQELIEGALKEAVYNGVSSLRYIDKILYEWQKNGVQKLSDVEKRRKEITSKKELFDYNWLEDET